MGNFAEQGTTADGPTHYADEDDDILEFWPTYGHDGVVLDTTGEVIIAKEDLVEFFGRASKMAGIEGTFVPKSENKVTTIWGRTHCGTGDSEASVINGFRVETIRELAANLLAIADEFDKEEEWKEAAEKKKKAHDDLRTSEIALEALELYKRRSPAFWGYASWEDTDSGRGVDDTTVQLWIEQAERKREESQPQVGDLVRVAADAKTVDGYPVHFGRSVVGEVARVHENGDRAVRTKDPETLAVIQVAAPKFLTVIATAADVETLRDSVLLGARKYEDLTAEQQHLVDEVIAHDQEK